MKRSSMYGNRGAGRFGNQQQGLLGNANMMMAGQMGGMANMQLLNQGGGRDLRGGPGLFPMNPSLGMREMQQPGAGGFNVNNRMNMPSQPRDAVLDILPRRTAVGGMQRGGDFERRDRLAPSFSPPMKRSRPVDSNTDDIDVSDRRSTRSKFKCQVCRLQFASMDEFDVHMDSDGHAANMKVMSAVYHDKNQQLLSSSFDTQKRRQPASARRDGICPVCERTYGGISEYEHLQSKQHKHRLYLVKKGCMLCAVHGFDNYPAYVSHIDSAEHKQKKRDLPKPNTGTTSSSPVKSQRPPSNGVRSSVKTPPAKQEAEVVQKSPVAEKRNSVDNVPTESENASPPSDITETTMIVIDGDDQLDELVYNPDIAVGGEHVISVTGYFCKLCHKFYNNEEMARITHCKSETHFNKYLDHQRQKSEVKASPSSVPTSHHGAKSAYISRV